jgi:hypothetical protein
MNVLSTLPCLMPGFCCARQCYAGEFEEGSHQRADQSIVFNSIKNPIDETVMASAKMASITGKLPILTVFMLVISE